MKKLVFPKEIKFEFIDYSLRELDEKDLDSLIKGELSQASQKRKIEFIAGRIAAKTALGKIECFQEVARDNGVPVWPAGITGSISHSKGLALAVVTKQFNYVGVDLEKIITEKKFSTIESKVLTESEKKTVTGLSQAEYYTLVFSAKEAFYKFLYPKVKNYFGFLEASITSLDMINQQGELELNGQKDFLKNFNGKYNFSFGKYKDFIIVLFYSL